MHAPWSVQRYTSLKSPIGFAGRGLVKKYTYPRFKSDLEVQNALAGIDSYTRHRAVRPVKSVPYILYNRRVLCEVDLTDRQDLKEWNDDYGFWFILIDCFSRKVWGRLLKRKTDVECVKAMEDIVDSMPGPTVQRCRSDSKYI